MRGSFYTNNQLDWGSRREVTRDILVEEIRCKGATLTSIMYNNNSDKVMTYGDTLLEIVKSTLLVLFTFTTIRVARRVYCFSMFKEYYPEKYHVHCKVYMTLLMVEGSIGW